MIGLDVKAKRKLVDLEGVEVSDFHNTVLTNLRNWYLDPEHTFYTSAQRKQIDEIHMTYLKPLTFKERYELDAVQFTVESPYLQDSEREICLSILGKSGDNPRAWSPKQGKFLRKMCKAVGTRMKQKIVRDNLELAMTEGSLPPRSVEFCSSIIGFFDSHNQWTDVQMEHAEKILAGNEDPDEDEVK